MKRRYTLLLSAFVLLTGCASNSARFPGLIAPSPGKAVVYIYRVDTLAGDVRVAPNVRINNASQGPLLIFGYFRVEVAPGPMQVALYRDDKGEWGNDTLWRATQDVVVNLRLAPNSIHFVQFSLDRIIFSFKETPRSTALQALPDLRPLN